MLRSAGMCWQIACRYRSCISCCSFRVPIVIDGQVMHIQKNLHGALSVAGAENAYRKNPDTPTRVRDQTFMHRAAEMGRLAHIRLWVGRGVDVNVEDADGRIPLHDAASNGHHECVQLLCEAGSRRAVADKDGKTPEDLAEAAGHDEVV